MSGSASDQDDFRIDRSSGKTAGPGGGRGSDIDPSYEDAMAILGRKWQAPPPYVQYVVSMQDGEGRELALRLTQLRQSAGRGLVVEHASPLGDAVEAFIRALRETAPLMLADSDPLPPRDAVTAARLGAARALIEQLADQDAVREALVAVCAVPPIAARM
jgi:hypothetical protein